MDNYIKGFYIPSEAWYKNTITEYPKIEMGFYYEDGSTAGEFGVTWDNVGIRLSVYNDSWEVLSRMPELIGLLARYDREGFEPDIKEFAKQLKEMGFKDITEREMPMKEMEDEEKKMRKVLKEARMAAGMRNFQGGDGFGQTITVELHRYLRTDQRNRR